MRSSLLGLPLVMLLSIVGGCGGARASGPVTGGPPPPAPPGPALAGTIGGRPFIAKSALMTGTNVKGRMNAGNGNFDVSLTTIMIFERPMTCAELTRRGSRLEPNLASGEHSIELFFQATWPVFPNSTWKTGEPDPARDQLSSITFKRTGSNGGVLANGSVQFTQAAPEGGALTLQATSMTAAAETAGQVSGGVAFAVCR